MNELIAATVSGGDDVLMSTRDIAGLCEKEHFNVMRDVKNMLETIGLGPFKFEGTYTDAQGKDRKEYRLPKDLTITLVTGYRADLRYKVVKRLEELELEKQRGFVLPDFTNPAEAARAWADAQEQKQIVQAQLDEAQPKAAFVDKFVLADGLYNLQGAGRALGTGPNKFIKRLKREYLFYQGGALVPYRKFVERGLFEVKVTMVDEKARQQCYVTPKGLEYFAKKLETEPALA